MSKKNNTLDKILNIQEGDWQEREFGKNSATINFF
tara:strand:- start:1258 stop:1362 length:105 start_codon:yes stop_codon:yes gene_type:complete